MVYACAPFQGPTDKQLPQIRLAKEITRKLVTLHLLRMSDNVILAAADHSRGRRDEDPSNNKSDSEEQGDRD